MKPWKKSQNHLQQNTHTHKYHVNFQVIQLPNLILDLKVTSKKQLQGVVNIPKKIRRLATYRGHGFSPTQTRYSFSSQWGWCIYLSI